jgi:RNA polymerase sigma-70 factor (ECF subfamily)
MATPFDADPTELLSRHQERIRRLIARLVAPDDAADVEQEVWVAALERPPRHAAALPSWIATTVRNLVAKQWRGRARRRARESAAAVPEPQPATADLVSRVELEEFLLRCVRELPEPERDVVLLRFFEGLGSGEIAARLGVGESTVRARIARALTRLRERLDARSGGAREAWMVALAPIVVAGGAGTGALVIAGKVVAAALVVVALAGGVVWWGRAAPRAAERVADSKGPRGASLETTPSMPIIAADVASPQRTEEAPARLTASSLSSVVPMGVLAMRVVDAATSEPFEDVRVRAVRDERSVEAGFSLNDLRMELPLSVGTWDVAVSVDGYEPEVRRGVAITAGATTDLGTALLGPGTGSLSIRLRGVAHGAGVVRRIELRGNGRSACPKCAPDRLSIASTSTEPDPVDSSPYMLADSPCCGFFSDRSLGKVVDDSPFEFRGLAAGIYFVRVRDSAPRLQPTLRLELARGEHRVLDLDCLEDAALTIELEDDAGRPFVGLWEADGSETTAPICFTVDADGASFEVDAAASLDAVRAALGPPRTLTPSERLRADAEREKFQLEESARRAAEREAGQPQFRVPIVGTLGEFRRRPGEGLFGAPVTPSFECVEFGLERRAPAVFVFPHLPASRVTISARCRDRRAAPVELDLADPSQRRARLVLRAPSTDH